MKIKGIVGYALLVSMVSVWTPSIHDRLSWAEDEPEEGGASGKPKEADGRSRRVELRASLHPDSVDRVKRLVEELGGTLLPVPAEPLVDAATKARRDATPRGFMQALEAATRVLQGTSSHVPRIEGCGDFIRVTVAGESEKAILQDLRTAGLCPGQSLAHGLAGCFVGLSMPRALLKKSELDVVLRLPPHRGLSAQPRKNKHRPDAKTLASSFERACMMVNLRPQEIPADATWGGGPCASTTPISQSFSSASIQQSLFLVFNLTALGRLEVPSLEWVAGASPSGGATPTGALRLRLYARGADTAKK